MACVCEIDLDILLGISTITDKIWDVRKIHMVSEELGLDPIRCQ